MGEGVKEDTCYNCIFLSLRNKEIFTIFCDDAVESSGLTDEPILPRYKRAPKQLDDGAQPHCFTCPKDRFCHTLKY